MAWPHDSVSWQQASVAWPEPHAGLWTPKQVRQALTGSGRPGKALAGLGGPRQALADPGKPWQDLATLAGLGRPWQSLARSLALVLARLLGLARWGLARPWPWQVRFRFTSPRISKPAPRTQDCYPALRSDLRNKRILQYRQQAA